MHILHMYIIIIHIHIQLHLYKHRYSRQTPSGSNISKPFPGKREKFTTSWHQNPWLSSALRIIHPWYPLKFIHGKIRYHCYGYWILDIAGIYPNLWPYRPYIGYRIPSWVLSEELASILAFTVEIIPFSKLDGFLDQTMTSCPEIRVLWAQWTGTTHATL